LKHIDGLSGKTGQVLSGREILVYFMVMASRHRTSHNALLETHRRKRITALVELRHHALFPAMDAVLEKAAREAKTWITSENRMNVFFVPPDCPLFLREQIQGLEFEFSCSRPFRQPEGGEVSVFPAFIPVPVTVASVLDSQAKAAVPVDDQDGILATSTSKKKKSEEGISSGLIKFKKGGSDPLPEAGRRLMYDWFMQHRDNPYPNAEQKLKFAIEGGLTKKQIESWFKNARLRSKVRPP